MNKSILSMGLICAAAFTLTNCTKEIEPQAPVKEGVPFEITASINDTKTTNDGLNTLWAPDDAISVFHAEANSDSYGTNDQFTYTSGNSFSGTLSKGLEDKKSYDWYAIYNYYEGYTTPAASSDADGGAIYIGYRPGITQSGLNSTAHLKGSSCTMYGVAKNIASDSPVKVDMKHLTSVVKINVTNNSGADLDVSSISFTAEEDIVGSFYIDITKATPVYVPKSGSVSKVATLKANGETTLANGQSGAFYIPIKPFTAAAGSKLSLSVNGTEKEKILESPVTFTAGKIKTLNYTVSEIIDYVTLPWKENFSGDLGKYTLVSTTSETKIYNEATAGGTAPELLVAKNNGRFSAKVKASAGDYVLTFKSNHADYLSISVDEAKIHLKKESDKLYTLSIPDGVDFFNISFTNTNSSNTRLDDIDLKLDTRTVLATPVATAKVNSSTPNSIDVSWDKVANAGSYVVTATPATGSAVSETVTADPETTTYTYTISGLAYETEYTISVVAKPSDTSLYLDSAAGEAGPVPTGSKPSSGGEKVTLFSESFGDNSSSARVWNDTYKEQNGISSVYSGSTYTITNAKQSKNTVGKTKSGLAQSTQNQDAIFEIKGLNVAAYSELSVSYYWKAGSISKTYSTSLYYSKDGGTTYTEVEKTSGTGATKFVEVTYTLPADAVLSNLCLKVVFNTSNTQAVIDDFVLKGIN